MKYSTFKEEVENLNYKTDNTVKNIFISNLNGNAVVSISKTNRFNLSTDYLAFSIMNDQEKQDIITLALKLASTPPLEREEEKKYFLEVKIPHNVKPSMLIYINQEVKTGQYSLGSQHETLHWKTTFLKSELTDIDLTHINLIEVPEYD